MKIWYIQQMCKDTKQVFTANKGYSTFEKAKEAFNNINGAVRYTENILVSHDEYYEYSVRAMEIE